MNREQIENKDRQLLEKVRATVKRNEPQPIQSESVGKRVKPWLSVLFIALIVAGLWMFRQQSATTVSSGPVPAAPDAAQADTTPVDDRASATSAAADVQPHRPAPDPVPTVPTVPAAIPLAPAPHPPEATRQPAMLLKTMLVDLPEVLETVAPSSSVRIAEIVACRGVDQRQCVSPTTTFSLQETPTPVVWMNVLSDQQPFTLTHAYYLNGRKYCDVPLKIRYPRTRTWSNVTLAHPYQTGRWRVEVVDADGEKLSQIEFTVAP